MQNSATPMGGGVYNTGTLTLNDTYVESNAVAGGGLYNEATGEVIIKFSTFSSGSGSVAGHIFNDGGVVHSRSSLYTGASVIANNIQNMAGGLFVSNGDSFTNNQSSQGGSGVFLNHGTLELRNCLFDNNSTPTLGGALINAGSATIRKCTFVGNVAASGDGGAISNSGDLDIRKSAVVDNTAGGNGGGIASNGTLFIKAVTFSGNQAANFDDVWNTGSCTGCPS